MPSTMVHLLIAHQIKPDAPDVYWVGNFAPDFTTDRELKDKIHLRTNKNRWLSLKKMYKNIDKDNDFECGWFLHLFVDACWDEKMLVEYEKWYESLNKDTTKHWFFSYREEIGFISYYLYHNLIWAKKIWDLIKNTNLKKIETQFPITIVENELYRDRVYKKHSESSSIQNPSFFTFDKIMNFSNETADRYKKWIGINTNKE